MHDSPTVLGLNAACAAVRFVCSARCRYHTQQVRHLELAKMRVTAALGVQLRDLR